MMLPICICRHWHVQWLTAEECRCEQCGKIGQWFDGMVLWQRRPVAEVARLWGTAGRHEHRTLQQSRQTLVPSKEGRLTMSRRDTEICESEMETVRRTTGKDGIARTIHGAL